MQSARHSLIETLIGTAIGFVVSVLVWELVVNPVWHLETSFVSNLSITALFTIVSVIRGYVVRRIFNVLAHKNNKKEQHEPITKKRGRAY